MAEITLRLPSVTGDGIEFDDDSVHAVELYSDLQQVPCDAAGCKGCGAVHHMATQVHLRLDFKPGAAVRWRSAQAEAEPI